MSAAGESPLVDLDAMVRTARAALASTMLSSCDHAAAAFGSNRHLEGIWNSQQRVRHVLKNTFNEQNHLLRLPPDVLHLVVHNLDESERNLRRLRTTCRLFLAMIDRACFCIQWERSPYSLALFQESKLPPPTCKTLNWIFDPAMAGGEPSANWRAQLQQALVLNMHIPEYSDSPNHLANYPDLQQRWLQLVTALFESAPMLERLSLICDEYPPSGMEWTIPSAIFGGFAPRLKLFTVTNIAFTPIPTAFQHISILDYNPVNRRLSRTDLHNLFISLPRLKALKLRVYGILPYEQPAPVEGAFEAPVRHSLRFLQIYLRYGIPALAHYLLGTSGSSSPITVQCALRASTWWTALVGEIQNHMQLAFGFEITEVVLRRPSPSPPLRMMLHHNRGPEVYTAENPLPRFDPLIFAHHPLVTTLSISQFLWPQAAVVSLPALTSLTILVGRCAQYRLAARYTVFDDVFLWDTNSAVLDVPLLREVVIMYGQSDEWQACSARPRHACCIRGRMTLSAEVIGHVLRRAIVHQSTPLDVIRISGIEFCETEDRWRHQLSKLTRKVEDIGPPVDVYASLPSRAVLSRFEELADAHCRDGC